MYCLIKILQQKCICIEIASKYLMNMFYADLFFHSIHIHLEINLYHLRIHRVDMLIGFESPKMV